jgi:A/G-specific adenine glycosylase
VLLKRTRAEGAAGFFHSFIERYPSWLAISQASTRELGSALRPIGLWRQRASSLAALSAEMVVRNGRFPQDRDSIESLPGVGQYVANAIILFCNAGREPLLDAGMARVLERCFGERSLVDIRYDPWLQSLARKVVNCNEPVLVNSALLDLAALICHADVPDCPACPVRRYCKAANSFGEAQRC